MSAQERIDSIVNQIEFDNIHFPPRSAVGVHEWGKECARNFRIAAAIAADAGLREQAISLTGRAQQCDRAALSALPIPQAQRSAWY